MKTEPKYKPTKKQLEIMQMLYDGWHMFIGQSEWSGNVFYSLSFGYENKYFRSDVFSRLITDNIIWQGKDSYYCLTDDAYDYIHELNTN